MRKLSIYLIVVGGLFMLGASVVYGYSLAHIADIASACSYRPCEQEKAKLYDYQKLILYGQLGGTLGATVTIAGVVIFRKAENQAHKKRVKNKLFY